MSSLKTIVVSQILSFTGGQTHQYGDPSISSRFKFTGNPTLGDASISISDARVSDTDTYQCKVKKAPGVDTRKVTLVVMGEEFLLTGLTCSFSQTSCSTLKSCSHSCGM